MSSVRINLGFNSLKESQGSKFKDLAIPLRISSRRHQVEVLEDDKAISNAISNILTWRRGWRVIQPEFGNVLYSFVYQPIIDLTAKNIGSSIREMLERWEPRVTVKDVEVIPDPDNNAFFVTVVYTIPVFSGTKTYSISITVD